MQEFIGDNTDNAFKEYESIFHCDLMGDRFYDEAKFYTSNVHVILNRLDRVIREGVRK